jgi:hypothetical protein
MIISSIYIDWKLVSLMAQIFLSVGYALGLIVTLSGAGSH